MQGIDTVWVTKCARLKELLPYASSTKGSDFRDIFTLFYWHSSHEITCFK
jgi:hypothetical protein